MPTSRRLCQMEVPQTSHGARTEKHRRRGARMPTSFCLLGQLEAPQSSSTDECRPRGATIPRSFDLLRQLEVLQPSSSVSTDELCRRGPECRQCSASSTAGGPLTFIFWRDIVPPLSIPQWTSAHPFPNSIQYVRRNPLRQSIDSILQTAEQRGQDGTLSGQGCSGTSEGVGRWTEAGSRNRRRC